MVAAAATALEPTPPPANVRSPADFAVLREALDSKQPAGFSRADLGFDLARISGIRAVQLTLEANPQILLQDASVQSRAGTVQVAEGAFDTKIGASVKADLLERNRDQTTRAVPGAQASPSPLPNPLVTRAGVFEYEASVQKRLQNGIVVRPGVSFNQATNKDTGVFNNQNQGRVDFVVTIPLGKGGGNVVNKAPEISARYDLLASVLQLRFITTQSVRAAMEAYWRCRAAEEVYQLRIESEEISEKLVALSAQLVQADELAPAQLPQALADRASTAAARIQAEADLIRSRQNLATIIGWPPESLALAPLTADTFPSPPTRATFPDLTRLLNTAFSLRDDLRAAQETVKSRKILLDAAFLELRPTVNLQLQASYAPFETRTSTTITEGNQWQGIGQFSFEWPVENNTAIGSYLQSAAALRNTEVSEINTERVIAAGVISSLASLRAATSTVKLYAESTRLNSDALAAQEELFRLGQGTLTDSITSRERLIQSRLSYVGAQTEYAIALVNLRFETGTLLFSDPAGDWIDGRVWMTVPFSQATQKTPPRPASGP